MVAAQGGIAVDYDLDMVLQAPFQLTALDNEVTEETEQLILDFMAEVFFAWWACLYRPEPTSRLCSATRRPGSKQCSFVSISSAIELQDSGEHPMAGAGQG